jgi:hypothetical protein
MSEAMSEALQRQQYDETRKHSSYYMQMIRRMSTYVL